MAATHNVIIRKLLKDFKALPSELVSRYLVIYFKDSNMTANLANQTIYAAIREFVCYQQNGYLLANNYVKIDSNIVSGAKAFRVYLEFMEYIEGYAYCRPSSPWQIAFVAGDNTYYVVSIPRGREYQVGTLLSSFGADEKMRENVRRIGILEDGADVSLVPYCGIMQFCVVHDDYEIDVISPDDRDTIEKAWRDVQEK